MATVSRKAEDPEKKVPDVSKPEGPGLSAKINGGSPFVRYVIAFTIASLTLFAAYAALIGIL